MATVSMSQNITIQHISCSHCEYNEYAGRQLGSRWSVRQYANNPAHPTSFGNLLSGIMKIFRFWFRRMMWELARIAQRQKQEVTVSTCCWFASKEYTLLPIIKCPRSLYSVCTVHRETICINQAIKTDVDVALMHSPVVASIVVISQTLTTSTMTSRAPLLPICVYRSLILGKRKRTVAMGRSFIGALLSTYFKYN